MSDRRLAENEVFFRQSNEKIAKGFVELKELAESQGHTKWLPDADPEIKFYCECSDENCRKRIKLKSEAYQQLHKKRSHFLVLSGHHTPKIERVVRTESNYLVVEKYITPPDHVDTLHTTNLDNS